MPVLRAIVNKQAIRQGRRTAMRSYRRLTVGLDHGSARGMNPRTLLSDPRAELASNVVAERRAVDKQATIVMAVMVVMARRGKWKH